MISCSCDKSRNVYSGQSLKVDKKFYPGALWKNKLLQS